MTTIYTMAIAMMMMLLLIMMMMIMMMVMIIVMYNMCLPFLKLLLKIDLYSQWRFQKGSSTLNYRFISFLFLLSHILLKSLDINHKSVK